MSKDELVMTCHQPGCENAEIPMPIPLWDDPEIPYPTTGTCGGCNGAIADMRVVPSGTTPVPTAENLDAIRAAAIATKGG